MSNSDLGICNFGRDIVHLDESMCLQKIFWTQFNEMHINCSFCMLISYQDTSIVIL